MLLLKIDIHVGGRLLARSTRARVFWQFHGISLGAFTERLSDHGDEGVLETIDDPPRAILLLFQARQERTEKGEDRREKRKGKRKGMRGNKG